MAKGDVTVTVDVTQKDIARGKPGDCWWCPIALAARRALGGWTIHVSGQTLSDGEAFKWSRKMPMVAHIFQVRFDSERPVSPFAFKLRVPRRCVLQA